MIYERTDYIVELAMCAANFIICVWFPWYCGIKKERKGKNLKDVLFNLLKQ